MHFAGTHTIYIRLGVEATDPAWREYLSKYSRDVPTCMVSQIQTRIEGSKKARDGRTLLIELLRCSPWKLGGPNRICWQGKLLDGSQKAYGREWEALTRTTERMLPHLQRLYGIVLKADVGPPWHYGPQRLHIPNAVRTACVWFEWTSAMEEGDWF